MCVSALMDILPCSHFELQLTTFVSRCSTDSEGEEEDPGAHCGRGAFTPQQMQSSRPRHGERKIKGERESERKLEEEKSKKDLEQCFLFRLLYHQLNLALAGVPLKYPLVHFTSRPMVS